MIEDFNKINNLSLSQTFTNSTKNSEPAISFSPPPCPTCPEPLKNVTEIDIAFYRLTRRIPKKMNIEQQLAALPNKESEMTSLVEALNNRDWKHEIFQNPDYPLYALAAVKEGKLSVFAFSTLMLYWTAVQEHVPSAKDIESVPLFYGIQIYPPAFELIKSTLKHRVISNSSFLTDEQLYELFTSMRNAPASEQQIFLIRDDMMDSITNAIQNLGINIFADAILDDLSCRMIPSLTLMQNFLNIKFGPQARKINPVLGLSSFQDIIANGCFGERDMAIPSPFAKLPPIADHFKADGINFTYHDFYHAFLISGLPQEHGPAFIRAAQVARYAFNNNEAAAREYASRLVDMECSLYRPDYPLKLSLTEKFWLELIDKSNPGNEILHIHARIFDKLLPIITDALIHQEEWKTNFGLDLDLESLKLLNKRLNSIPLMALFWSDFIGDLQKAQQVQTLIKQGKIEVAKTRLKFHSPPFFAGFTDPNAFAQVLPSIVEKSAKELNLTYCNRILDDRHIKIIATESDCIKLDLTGCKQLTSDSLNYLKKLKLRSLVLSGCNQLIDNLDQLPSDLKDLDLSGIKELNEYHIEVLAKTCPQLKSLNLSRCTITDKIIEQLKSFPKLKKIDLGECLKLTDQNLAEIAKIPKIKRIYAYHCPKITKETCNQLVKEYQEKIQIIF